MSSSSLAPDFDRGLEVKPEAGSGPGAGASPAPEPGASGDPAPGTSDPDDRKALNSAKEALKVARRLEQRLGQSEQANADLMRQNQQLVERILNGDAPAAENNERPHSAETIQALLQGNDLQAYHTAVQENFEWARERDREAIRNETAQTLDTRERRSALRSRLLGDLGLGAENAATEEIENLSNQLMREFPGELDKSAALIAASGIVYRKAAVGEVEFDDLRSETVSRTTDEEGSLGGGSAGIAEKTKIDWDAPNRGLPPQIAQRVEDFGLGKILKKSDDPTVESIHRQSLNRILPQLQQTERARRLRGQA